MPLCTYLIILIFLNLNFFFKYFFFSTNIISFFFFFYIFILKNFNKNFFNHIKTNLFFLLVSNNINYGAYRWIKRKNLPALAFPTSLTKFSKRLNLFLFDKDKVIKLFKLENFGATKYKHFSNYLYLNSGFRFNLENLFFLFFKNKNFFKRIKSFLLLNKKKNFKELSGLKKYKYIFLFKKVYLWLTLLYLKKTKLFSFVLPINYALNPKLPVTAVTNEAIVSLNVSTLMFVVGKKFYRMVSFLKKLYFSKKNTSTFFFKNSGSGIYSWFFFFNFFSNQVYINLENNYLSSSNVIAPNLAFLKKTNVLNSIFFRIYKNKVPDYFFFLNYFFKNFFELFFNQKIQLNFFFFKSLLKTLEKNNLFKLVMFKLKKFQVSIGKGFFLEETAEAIWLTFLLKDSFFFLNWLKKTMTRIYFKHHKKFLTFLKIIFSKIFEKILNYFNCLGFYFIIKGKIGVTGNAKKRKFSFSGGHYSLTTKHTKLTLNKTLVPTHTGVLGVKFLVIFR